MAMQAECPRCPSAVDEQDGRWVCPLHGVIVPLWRTGSADYDGLARHLDNAGGMPSWVPWPLPASWSICDFGAVRPDGPHAAATYVTCSGMTDTDGVVTLTAVTEEPGVGLGSRVAGALHDDPGSQMLGRPVETRARVGGASVPLWLLATEEHVEDDPEDPWDRAALVGEARGRWLWLVVTPASATLGLTRWGPLEDLGSRGPELVDLPFAPRPREW